MIVRNGFVLRQVFLDYAPPRALITRLPRGTTFGRPGDAIGQQYVLTSALRLLMQDAPLEPVYVDEMPNKDGY